MATRVTEKDKELIELIQKFNLLTVSQLSALSQRSCQVIRRRIRSLSGKGLINKRERPYGNGRGRPEIMILLTQTGRSFLNDNDHSFPRNLLDNDSPLDPICIDHDILTNWVFIHLFQIERQIPPLSVNVIPSNTNRINHHDRKSVYNQMQIPTSSHDHEFSEFIPDGIISITSSDLKKSLLFFLEVDMGTETLASPKNDSKDIRQKILNYQALFRTGQYKRFEKYFKTNFNGFRLLFVANIHTRLKSLCRVVQQMPPNDFVWLTDQEQMFSNGLSAKIWARGGRDSDPPQSILGPKLDCPVTVIDKS